MRSSLAINTLKKIIQSSDIPSSVDHDVINTSRIVTRKRCDPLDRFSRNDTTRNKIRKSRVHDGIDRITKAVENRD